MSETIGNTQDGLTRRGFLMVTAAVAAVPNGATAQTPPAPPDPPRAGLAIDALDLDAPTRADLENFAQPVLRETRWIDELPLDGVQPAFLNTVEDDWR